MKINRALYNLAQHAARRDQFMMKVFSPLEINDHPGEKRDSHFQKSLAKKKQEWFGLGGMQKNSSADHHKKRHAGPGDRVINIGCPPAARLGKPMKKLPGGVKQHDQCDRARADRIKIDDSARGLLRCLI